MTGGKPRLTYLITGLQFGGANVGMTRLLSQLPPEEFDVTVVSIAKTDVDVRSLLPKHVDVVQCDMGSKLAVHRLRPLIGELRRTDVLVCSLFHATMVGTLLGAILRVPAILVWHHNTEHPNTLRPIGYQLANRVANRILVDSNAVERILVEAYGVDADRISTLPLAGVDTTEFSPTAGVPRGDRGTVRVATVGRVTKQKGYPDLLNCARRLGGEFQFHVAGTGPKVDELTEIAPPNVRFHGKISQDDMAEFYASADVYFQPSRWEGLCMTVIEAMACGRPVVASSVGGISESVVHGETGLLCPPGDIDCYCEHLQRLAGDGDRRESMGLAGRERVQHRYSSEVLGERFREALSLTGSFRTPNSQEAER